MHNWSDEIIKYIIFGNKYHVTVLLLLIIRELLSRVVLCMATYKYRISTSIFAHVSLHYTLKSNGQGVIVSSLSFFFSFSGRQFLTQWLEFSQCNRSNNMSFGKKQLKKVSSWMKFLIVLNSRDHLWCHKTFSRSHLLAVCTSYYFF